MKHHTPWYQIHRAGLLCVLFVILFSPTLKKSPIVDSVLVQLYPEFWSDCPSRLNRASRERFLLWRLDRSWRATQKLFETRFCYNLYGPLLKTLKRFMGEAHISVSAWDPLISLTVICYAMILYSHSAISTMGCKLLTWLHTVPPNCDYVFSLLLTTVIFWTVAVLLF